VRRLGRLQRPGIPRAARRAIMPPSRPFERRITVALAVSALLLAVVIVVLVRTPRLQEWVSPPVLDLPGDDQVIEVRASLREFRGLAALPEFTVPPAMAARVGGWLRPTRYVPNPEPLAPDDLIGEVRVRSNAGHEIRLEFYWTGR